MYLVNNPSRLSIQCEEMSIHVIKVDGCCLDLFGYYNKLRWIRWLINNRLLSVLEVESWKSGSGIGILWIIGCKLLIVSSQGERKNKLSGEFYEGVMLLSLLSPQGSTLLMTIILGFSISTWIWEDIDTVYRCCIMWYHRHQENTSYFKSSWSSCCLRCLFDKK